MFTPRPRPIPVRACRAHFCRLACPSAGAVAKNSACQCRRCERLRFDPWVGKIPWRREWQTAPIFLPGESHGQGSLVGYSPGGRKESDTTERLPFLSFFPVFLPGEFYGQRSLVDIIHGVANSQTQLNVCVRTHTHTHTHANS